MRIAIGSDERSHLADTVLAYLRQRGHTILTYGALADDPAAADWPVVSAAVAGAVATGQADEGIVLCWTGTGATMAANKVPGIRAALCGDAETARGARVWNHANVLALSLRATSDAIALEILDAWGATPWSDDAWNRAQIARLAALESALAPAPAEPP
jgi:ribose 5-phosphate isomerase B